MYVFENLDLYNKAVGLTALTESLTETFPSSTDYFSDRLKRVARSIHANLAEAHGHWKDAERREFFWKAREATQEWAGLIDIAVRQGLMENGIHLKLRSKLDSLQKMIQDALRQTEKKPEPVLSAVGSTDLKIL